MKTFEIIAGTYEEFLVGYYFNTNNPSLAQSFASHDHSSSLRSLATSGHYVASGAADDRIIVYDFKARKEYCMLTHHKSTISCLRFTRDHSHLVSASSDGVLSIVRVGNWKVEKIWDKAHNGSSIIDIALHPSGKLALTLGADCSLRTWNLVKGRKAYAINLTTKSKDAKSLEKIVWAEDGVRFLLYGGKYTEIWSIEIGGVLKVIEHHDKVTSCLWYSDEEILVGYEDGQLAIIHIDSLKKNVRKAHTARVKAISRYLNWFVTASSSGEIKVWNMKLEELASCRSGCRITCLEIVPLIEIKEEKKEDDAAEENKQENYKVSGKRTVVIEEDSDSSEEKQISSVKKLKQLKNNGKKDKTLKREKGEDAEIQATGEKLPPAKKKRQDKDDRKNKGDMSILIEKNVKKSKRKKN